MILHFKNENETAEMNLNFVNYFCYGDSGKDKIIFDAIINTFGNTIEDIDNWFEEAEQEIYSQHDEEWWKKYKDTKDHEALAEMKKRRLAFRKKYKLVTKKPSFIAKMEKMKIREFYEDEPMSANDGRMIVWAHVKQDDFSITEGDKFKRLAPVVNADTELVGYVDEGKKFMNLALNLDEDIEAVKFGDRAIAVSLLKIIASFLDVKSTINFYRNVNIASCMTKTVIFTCDIKDKEVEFICAEMKTDKSVDFTELGAVNIL